MQVPPVIASAMYTDAACSGACIDRMMMPRKRTGNAGAGFTLAAGLAWAVVLVGKR